MKAGKPKGGGAPRAALQRVFAMAEEMAHCPTYMDFDEVTGDPLGPSLQVEQDLEKVRRFFKLKRAHR